MPVTRLIGSQRVKYFESIELATKEAVSRAKSTGKSKYIYPASGGYFYIRSEPWIGAIKPTRRVQTNGDIADIA